MMNPLQLMFNSIMNSPKMNNNPMAKNVLDMARSGDVTGIEQFGRNIAKERGVDFDQAFANFKNQFSK